MADLYQIYRDHYFHELDTRDKLNGSLSFPMGIIAVTFGYVSFLFDKLKLINFEANYFSDALFCLGIALFFLASYFITRTYMGYGYRYIAYTTDIRSYQQNLAVYYRQRKQSVALAEQDTLEYVHSEYAECTGHNANENDRKRRNLFVANRLVIGFAFAILIGSIPATYLALTQPSLPQKFEITNIRDLAMSNPPKSPTPSKPTPPPSRLLKESQNPPPFKPAPPIGRMAMDHALPK